jgi:hypothetical protein
MRGAVELAGRASGAPEHVGAAGRSRASLTLRLPVEYVVFPDEGHGWCKIANRSTSTVAITLFFVKYLKGSDGHGRWLP